MFKQYYDSVLIKSTSKITWILATTKTKRFSQSETLKALAFDLYAYQIKLMCDAAKPCCQLFVLDPKSHFCPHCGTELQKFTFSSFLGLVEQLYDTEILDANVALNEYSFNDSSVLENSLGTVVCLVEHGSAILCHALIAARPDLLNLSEIPKSALDKKYLWDQIRISDLTNGTTV